MDLQTPPFTVRFSGSQISFPAQRFSHPGHYWIQDPSGTGKTTYFRYLMDLLPPEAAPSPPFSRNTFAWVPQSFQLGLGKTSGLLKSLIPEAFRFQAILERLKTWDWPGELLEREFGDLSGGEKARLSLAIALECDRPWLLLDEGLSEIDPQRLASVMEDLNNSPKGILAISHQSLDFEKRSLFNGIT